MKHKHADLIHAWADGAEIQVKNEHGEWEDWKDEESPSWFASWEYRIKPEEKKPVVRWLWADSYGLAHCQYFSSIQPSDEFPIKLEWSRTEFPE